jgi:hypothetical protein
MQKIKQPLMAASAATSKKTSSKKKKYYRKDFQSQFNVRYIDHNEFKGKKLLNWDIKKDSEYTINPGLNDRLEQKYSDQIKAGYHAPMHIKYINKIIEYGAYAETFIKRGDMVVEYTGTVEVDSPYDEDNLYLWDYPTFYFETVPGRTRRKKIKYCINAETVGNYARFINHSLRKYQNVGIQVTPCDGKWHVIYVAKKDIEPGEQLLTYYGMGYWRDRKIIPFTITPDM